jgi:DNA-binding NarL/FixJ family response regulator
LVLSATAHAWFGLGIARAAAGDATLAHEAFEAARAIYHRLDHHAVIAFTYLTELIDVAIPLQTTHPDVRRRLVQEAGRALDRAGGALPTDMSSGRITLVTMALDGRWKGMRSIATESRTHGIYVLRRQLTRAMAPVALHQGDTDEAWRQVRAILPAGVETEPGSALLSDALMLQQVAVNLCLDAGNTEEAKRWLAANQRWLDWSGSVVGRSAHQLGLARLAAALRDHPGAIATARVALDLAMAPHQPLAELWARRLLGELLLADDRRAEAIDQLAVALDLAQACDLPYERAVVQVALASAHCESPEVARALAGEARSVLAELNARPDVARVDQVLAGLTAEPVVPAPAGGLTSRELEVLRLVAQGLTDAQIAERLYIGARTVNHHVRSIYDKLDIHSRAAATRFAMEHRLT